MDKNDKRNQSGGFFGRTTEGEFVPRSATSGVPWMEYDAPPPFPCYIGVDDALFVQVANFANALPCFINVRMLGLDGLIHPIQLEFVPAVQRAYASQRFNLMEGWLLSLAIITPGSSIGPGNWAYATAGIVRSPFGIGNQYDVLVAGYLDNNVGLSYPISGQQRPTDGQGIPQVVNPGNPAAGADISIAVPSGAIWRPVSLRATLTTAVAVANRLVSATYQSAGNVLMESPSNFTQAASIVNTYNFFDSAQYLATPFNLRTVAPLPSNTFLQRGNTINTVTTGIQAADQWSSVILLVQEWFLND